MRKPFQGVWNIIRFNWPMYVLALAAIVLLVFVRNYASGPVEFAANTLIVMIVVLTSVSLLVSWYVYDLSGFYELGWLDDLQLGRVKRIVNINAGFDETSEVLKTRFTGAELLAADFYEPKKHTAASIKRARNAYPPFSGTQAVSTRNIALNDNSADTVFVILSAHEIRDASERADFFRELRRIVGASGTIVVVEHLRDVANTLAYNLGAFHFHSRHTWLDTFKAADLGIRQEKKVTPLLTVFVLESNGTLS